MSSTDQKVANAVQNRYKNPDKTKREALQAIKNYRSLYPKLDKFVFNDGQEKSLLNLDGTIPVVYKGSSYNIPICMWLLDNYPNSAPMVYVKPTSDMLIKSSRHVDLNGKVYLPYLHEWNPNSSDLMGLIQIMIMTFAEAPPVYAKSKGSPAHYQTPYSPPSNPAYMPPGGTPATTASNPPLPYPTGGGAMPGATSSPVYTPYPATNPPAMPTPYPATNPPAMPTPYPIYPTTNPTPYPQPSSYAMPNPTPYPAMYPPTSGAYQSTNADGSSNTQTITEEHIRVSLISAVGDRLKYRLRDVYGGAQAEVSVLKQQQNDLNKGKMKLEALMNKMNQEKVDLEKCIRHLKEKEIDLKNSISKLSDNSEPLDIENAVTTTAPIYKQLLNAYAEDQAIQDAIYYLGEAVRRDVMDLDSYLKHVRSLSRKQFQLRATMMLCRRKANLPG